MMGFFPRNSRREYDSDVWARQLYYPCGEVRWSSGTLPTDRQFTGQRREASLGLYDYKARFYGPYLARWIQLDTIIPDPTNPQSLPRFRPFFLVFVSPTCDAYESLLVCVQPSTRLCRQRWAFPMAGYLYFMV